MFSTTLSYRGKSRGEIIKLKVMISEINVNCKIACLALDRLVTKSTSNIYKIINKLHIKYFYSLY